MREHRKACLLLLLLLALFFATRLVLLNAPAAYLGLLNMRPTPDPEEMIAATIGWEYLNGPLLWPFWLYINPPKDAGVPLMGALCAPFMAVMGPSYFCLKFVGTVFFAFTLLIVFHLLSSHFSTKAAVICLLLYIFASPSLLFTEYFVDGRYSQAFLIHVIILVFLFKVTFPSAASFRKTNAALLGALCGLALYWHPTLASSVLLCAVVLLLYRRRFFVSAEVLVAAAAFVPLFFAALPSYLSIDTQAAQFYQGAPFLSRAYLAALGVKIRNLFLVDLAGMNNFELSLPAGGRFLNYLPYGLFVVSYCVLLAAVLGGRRARECIARFEPEKVFVILLAPALPCMVALLMNYSDYNEPFRRRFILTAFLSIPMVIAIFSDGWMRKSRKNIVPWSLVAILCGTGLISTSILSLPRDRELMSIRATAYGQIGGGIYCNYRDDLNAGLRLIAQNRSGEERLDLMRGFFRLLNERDRGSGKALALGRRLDEEFRPYYFRSIGESRAWDFGFDFVRLQDYFRDYSEEERLYCFEGAGSRLAYLLTARPRILDPGTVIKYNNKVATLPPAYRAACYRGFGAVAALDYRPIVHFGLRMGRAPRRFEMMLRLVPPEYRNSVVEGVNLGYHRFPEY